MTAVTQSNVSRPARRGASQPGRHRRGTIRPVVSGSALRLPLPDPTRWWMLGVVSLSTFMLMLDLSIVAVALPDIQTSLNATFSELQWVVDSYTLTLAAALVTAGSLADRSGRKRLFQIGLVLFTTASLACGFADSAMLLNIGRALQGIGGAILFATGPALIGHGFHGKERAAAFGVFGASAGLAIASGPLVGGALTSGISWRWIFLINLPIGVLAVLVTAVKVRESQDVRAKRADWTGMVLFTLALTALVFGVIRGNAEGWTSSMILGCFAVAAVMLCAFVAVEWVLGDRAMIELALFRNVTFVGMSLVALIANGAGLPSIFLETNYVQNVLESSAWEAGLQFMPLTVALFIAGGLGGAMTGRIPFRLLMATACAALGIGLLLTLRVGAVTPWTALIPSMIFTGIGMGLFNPTRAALAISVTEPERAGVASGINETISQVGTALGIAAVGALFQSRVTTSFVDSPGGEVLGDQARRAGEGISAGAIDEVSRAAGPLHDVVVGAARESFVLGFHDAMTACALFAFVAAVIAALMLRTKDLHASALSLVPPDTSAEFASLLPAPDPAAEVPGNTRQRARHRARAHAGRRHDPVEGPESELISLIDSEQVPAR